MVIRGNHSLVAWTMQHRLMACFLTFLAFATIGIPNSLMEVTAFGQDAVDDDANFRVRFETDFTLPEAQEQIGFYTDASRLRNGFSCGRCHSYFLLQLVAGRMNELRLGRVRNLVSPTGS